MPAEADTEPVPTAKPSTAALAAGGTVLLWASAFPAITVADALGPAALSIGRLVVASVALAVVAPFLGVRRPARRDLGGKMKKIRQGKSNQRHDRIVTDKADDHALWHTQHLREIFQAQLRAHPEHDHLQQRHDEPR